MNILSIDANYWVSQGLGGLLKSRCHRLLTCSSLSEARKILIKHHVDVVVMELRTEVDHVESSHIFLRLLKTLLPHIRVLILTEITDAPLLNFFSNALSPATVLTKKTSLDEIQKMIIMPDGYVLKQRRHSSLFTLSPQEFNMLKWFAKYSSQQEIAMRLNLNNKTISHYKRSIYQKLRCQNNVQFHNRLNQYGFNKIKVS